MALIKSWRSNRLAEQPYKDARQSLVTYLRGEGVRAVKFWGEGRRQKHTEKGGEKGDEEEMVAFTFIWIFP